MGPKTSLMYIYGTLCTLQMHDTKPSTQRLHGVKSVQTEVISGPHFPVIGPEITPYLDTFHAVLKCKSSPVMKETQVTI